MQTSGSISCLVHKVLHPPNNRWVLLFTNEFVKIKKRGRFMENLEILKQWIAESKNIVFFGGAGVSTE